MGFFFLGYVLVLSTVLLDDDGLLPSVLWVVPLQVLKLLVVLYITTRHVDGFLRWCLGFLGGVWVSLGGVWVS